jgi:uncharacterized protein (DUF2141 family)
MSGAEIEGKKGVYVYANLIDTNQDGKIDMISFVDPNGRAVGLAVDNDHSGLANNIHVFQDVTGDGKLDGDDVRLIRKLTRDLYRRTDLVEGQLELFVEGAAYG